MPSKVSHRRHEADPDKNKSGMTADSLSSSDQSDRDVNSGNGTRIAAKTLSHSKLSVFRTSRIPNMRSLCSSAAMILSADVEEILPQISRGKAGQTSKHSLADILGG